MPYLQLGDQIKVGIDYSGGIIEHHGIYVGEIQDRNDVTKATQYVVHFRKDNFLGETKIQLTTIDDFGESSKIKVVTEPPSKYQRAQIVKNAFALLDEYNEYSNFFEKFLGKGYNIATFNCEHLAVFCRTGKTKSSQVDNLINAVKEYAPIIQQAYLSR